MKRIRKVLLSIVLMFSLIVVIDAFGAVPAFAAEKWDYEIGINDTIMQAYELSNGEVINGTVIGDGGSDYFKYVVKNSGSNVVFSIEGDGLFFVNTYLNDKSQSLESDGYEYKFDSKRYCYEEGTVYYLEIKYGWYYTSKVPPTTTYKITVKEEGTGWEVEPNGSFPAANDITISDNEAEAFGTIFNHSDNDYFRVVADSSGDISFSIQPKDKLNKVGAGFYVKTFKKAESASSIEELSSTDGYRPTLYTTPSISVLKGDEVYVRISGPDSYSTNVAPIDVMYSLKTSFVPSEKPGDEESKVEMYRLYNRNSGEHFYTSSIVEKNNLSSIGWVYEGIGWTAPEKSNTPVYRLYNANAGDHHYTTDKNERSLLISAGWNDEGIGWYSAESKRVPLYREYNPNAVTGTHNYTTSKSEHDNLVSLGWKDEGIGWYGVTPPDTKYNPGDIVILGSYEQDNDLSNGAEQIEWIVVGERDGHTLILSKYALDYKKYNEELYKDITWEDCTLRSWLNNDFYNNAFSASDKGRIATAHNENPDTYELYKDYDWNNQTWGAQGGNATYDKVFLLSWTEARDYYGGKLYAYDLGAENYNQKLLCRPTAYAKANGASGLSSSDNDKYYHRPSDVVGCCGWWLRSPGPDQTGSNASSVVFDGSLSQGGDNSDGGWNGVRPALLID